MKNKLANVAMWSNKYVPRKMQKSQVEFIDEALNDIVII
ncbi:hypothetical protein KP78_33080 [Jeotgalibacillus soli]|uniref:Uncharacterized protein n=1 Tax=Jeotgalibacillus soli TaxID=889306 RepID=A0A0C2RRG3_9BACL|nr:hypothetical protein KP78_33080 [Jeotgalibacillus soli]